MSNIFQSNIMPKTIVLKEGRHDITITFSPETRQWNWTAKVHKTYDLVGQHTTAQLAEADARKKVRRFSEDNG